MNNNIKYTNLPDFLCIGAPKCGSTWLQFLLDSHVEIFIPKERNEIHFFDRYYDKGLQWYEHFFKNAPTSSLKGEVTPHYLYIDNPEYIRNIKSINKLILIYRNPIDRCISHYKFRIRQDKYDKSLNQFIKDYPESLEWGLYGKYLEKFLRIFNRDDILVLQFEKATKDIEGTKKTLAKFLNININGFLETDKNKKVNVSFIPKYRMIYFLSNKVSSVLLRIGLYSLRNLLKQNYLLRKFIFKSTTKKFELEINKHTILWLENFYKNDQIKLNGILHSDQK